MINQNKYIICRLSLNCSARFINTTTKVCVFSVVSVPHKRKRFEFSKKNLFIENLQRLRLGLTILSYVLNFVAEKKRDFASAKTNGTQVYYRSVFLLR